MTVSGSFNSPHFGKKAVIMSRVSSDDQSRNYSLGAQEEALIRYCDKNNISIVKKIREDHSAKDFNRPEFQNFLSDLKHKRIAIDLLLFITWDRFSRNAPESYQMINRLNTYGVSPCAIEQPLDLSIPENKVMLAMYVVLPEIDNDRRGIKTRTGIIAARAQGRLPGRAPLGYINARDEQNKPIIIPSSHAQAVKYLFEEIGKGTSQAMAIKLLHEKYGVRVSKNRISQILRSIVYAGFIDVPAFDNEKARVVKGIHDPIISLEQFNKVQLVLDGKNARRGIQKPKAMREELQFRGVLQCEYCGSHVTGSASRGKSGKRHFYYHCNSCKKSRYRAEDVHSWVEKILAQFQLTSGAQELYTEIKKDLFEAKRDHRTVEMNVVTIENELNRLNAKRVEIQEKLINDTLGIDQFSAIDKQIEEKIQALNKQLESVDVEKNDADLLMEKMNLKIQEVLDFKSAFSKATMNERIKILSSTFKEKLIYSKNESRTPILSEIFEFILLKDSILDKQKAGQLVDKNQLSRLVARRGIEPLLPG